MFSASILKNLLKFRGEGGAERRLCKAGNWKAAFSSLLLTWSKIESPVVKWKTELVPEQILPDTCLAASLWSWHSWDHIFAWIMYDLRTEGGPLTVWLTEWGKKGTTCSMCIQEGRYPEVGDAHRGGSEPMWMRQWNPQELMTPSIPLVYSLMFVGGPHDTDTQIHPFNPS